MDFSVQLTRTPVNGAPVTGSSTASGGISGAVVLENPSKRAVTVADVSASVADGGSISVTCPGMDSSRRTVTLPASTYTRRSQLVCNFAGLPFAEGNEVDVGGYAVVVASAAVRDGAATITSQPVSVQSSGLAAFKEAATGCAEMKDNWSWAETAPSDMKGKSPPVSVIRGSKVAGEQVCSSTTLKYTARFGPFSQGTCGQTKVRLHEVLRWHGHMWLKPCLGLQ